MTASPRAVLWKRLSLESAVIVASILLAFAIDAAWDQFQEARRVQDYLLALEGEFQEALVEMDDQISDHTRQLASVDSLIQLLASGEPSDRMGSWLDDLRAVYVFGPYHPVFEDLANATSVDLLGSPELRFALLRYGQAKEFLAVLSARELRLWEDRMNPHLLENLDVLAYYGDAPQQALEPRFPSGLESLYRDRYFQNLLLQRRGIISSQLGLDDEVRRGITDVLEQIAAQREGSV